MKGTYKKQRGSSIVEYALLCSLIAVVCIGSIRSLEESITANLNIINGALEGEDGGFSGAGGINGPTTLSPP